MSKTTAEKKYKKIELPQAKSNRKTALKFGKDLKKGSSINGTVEEVRQFTNAFGNDSCLLIFKDNKPEPVWCPTMLKKLLIAGKVRKGDDIKIVYLGKGKAKEGFQAAHQFDLMVA